MVASTRAIPEAPKLVRKRSKSKNRTQSPSTSRLAGANATVSRKRETYDINQYKQQIEDMCPSKKRVATLNKKPAPSSPAAAVSKATSSVNTTSATITTTNTNITTTTTTVSNSFMDNGSSFIDNSFIVHNSYNYNQPQQVQPFDIFAFDPAPTSHITYNMNAQAAAAAANFSSPSPSTLLPALPFQSTYYPNTATMYNTNIYNDNTYNNALQSSFYLQHQPFINNNNNNYNHTNNDNRNMSANNNQLYHSLSTASILNGNSTITSQYNTKQALQKPTVQAIQKKKGTVEKRPKKLNLVAHLKGANGEKENHDKTSLINKEFDFLSDEEDIPEQSQQNEKSALSPLRDIINTTKNNREPSLSPELTYAERMELELEAIMKSEFEGDNRKTIKENELETKETIERRPRYQPLNKVNVRVTFQKPAAATTITNHQ
ncbi:MAG: hypothetical protein EXX96DRAFT_549495 [Benjaminiella poitrasii]|nr:MAG: hypothetical protein EXX96DRAFT_549495 [Benjaminiella poitrasii]